MTIQWTKPTPAQLDGFTGNVIAYKFLTSQGSTIFEQKETFYPLPVLPKQWGPWLVHDDHVPAYEAGFRCGKGAWHLKRYPGDFQDCPDGAQFYIAQGLGLVNKTNYASGADEIARVKAVRLMRVSPDVWQKLWRRRQTSTQKCVFRLSSLGNQSNWSLADADILMRLPEYACITNVNVNHCTGSWLNGRNATAVDCLIINSKLTLYSEAPISWLKTEACNCVFTGETGRLRIYDSVIYDCIFNGDWENSVLPLQNSAIRNAFIVNSRVFIGQNTRLVNVILENCDIVMENERLLNHAVGIIKSNCRFWDKDGNSIPNTF